MVIADLGLNARQQPASTADVLAIFYRGMPLLVTGRTPDGAWLQLALDDDRSAWVEASLIQLEGSLDALPIENGGGQWGAQPVRLLVADFSERIVVFTLTTIGVADPGGWFGPPSIDHTGPGRFSPALFDLRNSNRFEMCASRSADVDCHSEAQREISRWTTPRFLPTVGMTICRCQRCEKRKLLFLFSHEYRHRTPTICRQSKVH